MAKVSIIMPVYNTKREYLEEAIDSILNQTFKDFEFIILDDCSNEETRAVLNAIDDPRVIVKRNPTNYGITKSLNIGFEIASGKYIARMDADDISLPNRIEKQVDYMENNPDVIVCGCGIRLFSSSSELKKDGSCFIRKIDNMERFRIQLLFYNCGPAHPSAMFNKQLIRIHSIKYDEKYINSQDYAMWVSCSDVGRMYILQEVLLNYRMHSNQISSSGSQKQEYYARTVRKNLLFRLFGTIDDEMVLKNDQAFRGEATPEEIISWYNNMKKANKKKKIYNEKEFIDFLKPLIYRQKILQYENKKIEKKNRIIAYILYAPIEYKRKQFVYLLHNRFKVFYL